MENKIELKFHGASKTVTGSCYEMSTGEKNYLIDCGMFQGPDVYNLNYRDFPFNPSEIDAVFLTHSHIDHCGLIPKLIKDGFNGTIFCTPPTAKLLNLILLDSANVQEKNYKFNHKVALYNTDDALESLNHVINKKFDETFFHNDLKITFRRSSHILGAASIEFNVAGKNITFSGDIGRRNPQIIQSFGEHNPETDYVIMESLYGNRTHENLENSVSKLCNIIKQTINRDGNVIVPCFAVHRLQEMMFFINNSIKEGRLDKSVQIFVDAPLGARVLDLYTNSSQYYSDEFKMLTDPFGLQNPNLNIVTSSKKSMRLKNKKGVIILTGGGMMDGGRIINHLHSFLSDKNSSLVVIGFQAEGTLGRKILERPDVIKINNKEHKVKIRIEEVYGFSAHGDSNDLSWWLSRFNLNKIKKIFLVHAEAEQSNEFKSLISENLKIGDELVMIPSLEDTYQI